jgi:hypothetical protein
MNANFQAIESAVDDNAARVEELESGLDTANTAIEENATAADDNTLAIANNADNIAALQMGLTGAGVQVRVADEVVGRFLTYGSPPVEVDVSGGGGVNTELVSQRMVIGTAGVISLVSPTGYLFSISTSDQSDLPLGAEGTLTPLVIWYGSSDCSGQAYLAVEGPTGLFSSFEPGTGDSRPVKRWFARQGYAFRSPDPGAIGEAYMVRRGQQVQQVALNSLYLWSPALSSPNCLDLSLVPGHTGNETNSSVLVEPLDTVETGIAADMAGDITIGL